MTELNWAESDYSLEKLFSLILIRETLQELKTQSYILHILNNLHNSGIKIEVVSHSSVQSLSGVQLFVTTWTATQEASQSITNPESS